MKPILKRGLAATLTTSIMAVSLAAMGDLTIKPLVPDVHIVSVEYKGTYTKGPIGVLVTIANRGNAPVQNVKVTMHRQFGAPVTATVFVDAHGTTVVPMTDSDGLVDACTPSNHAFELSGVGSIDARARQAHFIASCSFTAKIDDPYKSVSDDRVSDWTKGKVYVASIGFADGGVTSDPAPTCKQPFQVKALVLNGSDKSGKIGLGARDPVGNGRGIGGPVPIPAHSSKTIGFGFENRGAAGNFHFYLSDLQGSVGGALIDDQGITMNVARQCGVVVKLDP